MLRRVNDMNQDELKRITGERAAHFVQNDMVVGLGTGSTVYYTLLELARRMGNEDLEIIGIPTSKATESISQKLGIPLTTLELHPVIDLTIDGADEVDPALNLIKGLGGALLREKIVAKNSRQEIIVVDEGKMVKKLGTRSPLPVEVLPFGYLALVDIFTELGSRPVLRKLDDGTPFVTDSGNYVYDLHIDGIDDPAWLERELNNLPGVVENGLFLGMTTRVIVAENDGIKIIDK